MGLLAERRPLSHTILVDNFVKHREYTSNVMEIGDFSFSLKIHTSQKKKIRPMARSMKIVCFKKFLKLK